MKLQRIFSCITGVFLAVGFAASQAGAGTNPPVCSLIIEVNALRGGSPTVTKDTFKNITAKARIQKGTAESDTTIDTMLTVEAVDGTEVIWTEERGPIRLGVGKGGQGASKIAMFIPQCMTPFIHFDATFTEIDADGIPCTATRRITKTCKLN